MAEGCLPADFKRIEMVNWTALLGLEQGVKVRHIRFLDLPYEQYCDYVNKLKSDWKSNHENEQGSKCSIHAWHGSCHVYATVERAGALQLKNSQATPYVLD